MFSVLFFLSGFCSLIYQVVWLRLGFSHFGVITPVFSTLVSVFMAGLTLGAWVGGRWMGRSFREAGFSPLRIYAAIELSIGVGAFAVPFLFDQGSRHLLAMGQMDSGRYLVCSTVLIAAALLPWCFLMGMTFPVMLAVMRDRRLESATGFSQLYLANVAGAAAGTLGTAGLFIEAWGLRHTLWLAGGANALTALGALWLQTHTSSGAPVLSRESPARPIRRGEPSRGLLGVLFLTGFVSMGAEIIWTRAFTPLLKTTIYAFAWVLFTYLLATAAGTLLYRDHVRRGKAYPFTGLCGLLATAFLIPIILNDPRAGPGALKTVASIAPFCAVLGYLTALLVDTYSGGDPGPAGTAYALNGLGCVAGPLAATYLLLPGAGTRVGLLILSLPLVLLGAAQLWPQRRQWRVIAGGVLTLALLATAAVWTVSYEEPGRLLDMNARVLRDYAATVIGIGRDRNKSLVTNGIVMTHLVECTKAMAHLPLAHLRTPPQSALVICFGMGTTFRSCLSWGIPTTSVELIPSVKAMFSYFFEDAEAVLRRPGAAVVIDDGRRFLQRTDTPYDVIILDPPPPPEAASSSLLYSTEFYALAKKHLRPGGVLQQWFPYGEEKILQAIARSLSREFPYVKVYRGIDDIGYHFLASERPILELSPEDLVRRLPPAARQDVLEWEAGSTIQEVAARLLAHPVPIERLLAADPRVIITDDRPYNEYYFIRRLMARLQNTYVIVH